MKNIIQPDTLILSTSMQSYEIGVTNKEFLAMLDVFIETLERRRMKLNEKTTQFVERVNNGTLLYPSDSDFRNYVETTVAETRICGKLEGWKSFRGMVIRENWPEDGKQLWENPLFQYKCGFVLKQYEQIMSKKRNWRTKIRTNIERLIPIRGTKNREQ